MEKLCCGLDIYATGEKPSTDYGYRLMHSNFNDDEVKKFVHGPRKGTKGLDV